MRIKAVTFDAYGTLIRNETLMALAQRIVADHGLSVGVDAVWRAWIDGYYEATQATPFCTLRALQEVVFARMLRDLAVEAPAQPYVDLFFELTTKVELYPEVPGVLAALGALPSAIVSNADHEHVAAWTFTLPVTFVLVSETVQSYKPHARLFQAAVERFGVQPGEVLHVGDTDVDDVKGAKAAGLRVAWVNRSGRARRADVPPPDYEIADLTPLPEILRAAS